jgi:hypothetical protein
MAVFPAAIRVHGIPKVALLLCNASAAEMPALKTPSLGNIPVYPDASPT